MVHILTNQTRLSIPMLVMVLILVQTGHVRGQTVDKELLAQLKAALPEWISKRNRLKQTPMEFSWSFRSVVSTPSIKDDVIEATYVGSSIAGHYYIRHKSGIELGNPKYIASLGQGESEGQFFLKAGRFCREGITIKQDYRYGEFLGLITCGFGEHLGLEHFLSDEDQIKKLVRSSDNRIIAQWSLGKELRGIEGGISQIELDPANDFQIVRSERTVTLDRGTSTTKTEIVYQHHDTLGMIPQKLVTTETSTKVAGFSQKDSLELLYIREISASSKGKYFLGDYGVPESALAAFDIPPASSYRRFYFITTCVLLGVLFLGVGRWYSKSRRE